MSRFKRLVLAGVLASVLAGLLAAFLGGVPALAGPRSPDPELASPPGRTSERSAAKDSPTNIDSDIYAYAIAPSSRIYFVVAGHLTLTLTSGAITRYEGSFVDYVGNKSTKASVDARDASAPILKIKSRNGEFTFKLDQYFGSTFYTGEAVSKPSKLKAPLSKIVFGASTHKTSAASYNVTLTERSGAINNPVEYAGALTLAYDANGRVSGGQITVTNSKGKNVTHRLSSSGFYSSSYFYTVAQVDKKFFGLTANVSGSTITGYGFAADGAKTTQWVLSGTA